MTFRLSRRHLLQTAGTSVIAGFAGCLGTSESSPEEQARSHEETLSKYNDVSTALEDGYTMTTPYVRTDEGVLGLPFVNLEDQVLDPEHPSVLFYNLEKDGTYTLLGAKWLAPTESTDSPPSMFGREFDGPMQGETDFIPEHYGLHAWLFEDNPSGLFATHHKGASPPSYIDDLEVAWQALDPYFTNETKAQNAGFTNTDECVESSGEGYGIPFVNTDNTAIDPENPAVLFYRLSSSWAYNLLGSEWYVPADETSSPPSLFGQQFEGPMDGHGSKSDQQQHYGLHVWLYAANPNGMFARYNPQVQC